MSDHKVEGRKRLRQCRSLFRVSEVVRHIYIKHVKNLDASLKEFSNSVNYTNYFDIKPNIIIFNMPIVLAKYLKLKA